MRERRDIPRVLYLRETEEYEVSYHLPDGEKFIKRVPVDEWDDSIVTRIGRSSEREQGPAYNID